MIKQTVIALSAALLVGTVSAASAIDATSDLRFDSGVPNQTRMFAPEGAFAQSPAVTQRNATMSADAVYDSSGDYIGADPDVQIRSELQRNPPGRGD